MRLFPWVIWKDCFGDHGDVIAAYDNEAEAEADATHRNATEEHPNWYSYSAFKLEPDE